jgi:hypothetical protein
VTSNAFEERHHPDLSRIEQIEETEYAEKWLAEGEGQ